MAVVLGRAGCSNIEGKTMDDKLSPMEIAEARQVAINAWRRDKPVVRFVVPVRPKGPWLPFDQPFNPGTPINIPTIRQAMVEIIWYRCPVCQMPILWGHVDGARNGPRECPDCSREQWEQFGYEWAEVWLKIAHEQRARFGKALREMVEQFDALDRSSRWWCRRLSSPQSERFRSQHPRAQPVNAPSAY